MNDLQSLLQEREALENKIREARRQQIAQAIATCRKLIEEHALTESDLFGSGKGRRGKTGATGIKVAQIPQPRNRRNLDGTGQTAKMDSGPKPRFVPDPIITIAAHSKCGRECIAKMRSISR